MREPPRPVRLLADALRLDAPRNPRPLPGEDEWPAVVDLANRHFLAPALYVALAATERLDALPAELRTYLAMLHRANVERNRVLHAQAADLAAAFAAAAVDLMLLKGGADQFDPAHADPGARMVADLDLMVAEGAVAASVSVLEQFGYAMTLRHRPGAHAYADFTRPGAPATVDLHVAAIDSQQFLPAAEMRARAAWVAAGEARLLLPSRRDRLLHNLLHAQFQSEDFAWQRLSLRDIHDFSVMAGAFAVVADWSGIAACFAQCRGIPAFESYLLAAEDLFGLSWPLATPPTAAAAKHYDRCLRRMHRPFLARLGAPLGNLRAEYAAHRMDALYGAQTGLLRRRFRHTLNYLRLKRPQEVVRWLLKLR
ncbi:MAG: nucleotidyltransferase family protein [Rhodospirillales bacterium]|nr:nucleotidyltransferase family protein [Rhodospirillales bacterium]